MSSISNQSTLFYELARTLLAYFFNTFYDFTVLGHHSIPMREGVIFASNHASFFDPPAIGHSLPRPLNYFARDTLFKGVVGKIIRALNSIPVSRESADVKSLKAILKALKQNGAIVIFPEGTRTSDGSLQEPKPGTGMIACKSQKTVVPTRVFGTFEAFGRDRKFPSFGGPIHIVVGQPMSIDSLDPGPKHPERYLEISRRIMSEIKKLELPKQAIV